MTRPIKILAISHEFPPIGGGGASACFFLTKIFAHMGHRVTLVTANYRGLPESENLNGVDIVRVNSKREHKEHCSFMEMLSFLTKAYPKAKRIHKSGKYDICLIFFGIPSGPIGYMLKMKYDLPYIIRFGGGDIPGFQDRFDKVYKIIAPAIRRIWDNADALVANSRGLRQMGLDFYDKNDFRVICNGVDTEAFYPVSRGKAEFTGKSTGENDCIDILFVSRLIERKGLQHVIPKLREIKDRSKRNIMLTIVGDGPYRSELERIAKESNVVDMVSFVGQRDRSEILQYYQEADIFILPSKKEGMPNVVLEAMACGLPVVMTPCQGSEELIDGNGYVATIDQFAERVTQLVIDDELRTHMGARSLELIHDRFSWQKTAESYIDIMSGVLGN